MFMYEIQDCDSDRQLGLTILMAQNKRDAERRFHKYYRGTAEIVFDEFGKKMIERATLISLAEIDNMNVGTGFKHRASPIFSKQLTKRRKFHA